MSAPTNRTELVALAKEANKKRPSGKKVAVVGRTNEAIAKDLGISFGAQAKKASTGLMDDLDTAAAKATQKMAKKLGVKGNAVKPAAQKIEKAIAVSQKALPKGATSEQKHDAAVKAARQAAIAIKKDAPVVEEKKPQPQKAAATNPPATEVAKPSVPKPTSTKTATGKVTQGKVAVTKTSERKPEATGEQARSALAKLEAKHKELIASLQQKQQQALSEAKALAQKQGSKAGKNYYSEQAEQIKAKYSALEEKVLQKAREYLYVNNPSKMKVSTAGEFDPHTNKPTGKAIPSDRAKVYADGVEEFKKLVGIPSLDDKTLAVAAIVDPTGKKDRSYYAGNTDRVHMASKADKVVVIHEAAHWLEEKDPTVHKKVQAFLDKRTKGEDWQKLKDLTGHQGYRDNEVAKPDKFMRPYMGKKTRDGASEILSMGLEHMYRDPVGFAKKDPEYFDFIYNLMRGR